MSDLISTLRSKKTGVETEPPAEKKMSFGDRMRKIAEDKIKSVINVPTSQNERAWDKIKSEDEYRPAAVRG